MPYSRAHFWIFGLIMLLYVAFWPSYFSVFNRLSIALHIHGATSTLWLLLVVVQSWLVHNGNRKLHKKIGLASFVVFPCFLAGLFLVMYNNGVGLANNPDPARIVLGPAFSAVSAIVIITVSYHYFFALKTRNNFKLHAGYMLSIPVLLIEPVTSRLFNLYLPGFQFSGENLDNLDNASYAYYLSISLAILLTLWLYMRNRRFGMPFLFTAIMFLVQCIAYTWIGKMQWWSDWLIFMSTFQLGVIVTVAMIFGWLVTYFGWKQGEK
ncbi:hypothetical protein [Aliikangiella sp. G2MR2-5]|uniref:hypothetical protein n=1 Tax=Aliikangiella sp. G2MR2-5 TaxID=2788943 RepID=UPI0018AA556F|nr:hypothetical protein [Aliikangiella sp. G2MR2-5]